MSIQPTEQLVCARCHGTFAHPADVPVLTTYDEQPPDLTTDPAEIVVVHGRCLQGAPRV